MTYSRPPSRVLQSALHDAINWQVSFLDSMGNQGESDVVQNARQQLSDYRQMLKRRYGNSRTPKERTTDNMTRVNVRDLLK